MNLPFYIARRYLISKKSRNLINLISGISMAGITIGTMALILVLSFFNGLDSLIKSLFGAFDPELKITLVEGKTFNVDSKALDEVRNDPSVAIFCEVLEENALLKYGQQQAVATIKGVQNNFSELTGIDSLITDGKFQLYKNNRPTAVIGYDLAYRLSVGLSFINPLFIFVPKRNSGLSLNPANAFRQEYLYPSGVFSVQQEYDSRYIILPLAFVRDLLQYEKEASAIELKLIEGTDTDKAKKRFGAMLGKDFKIRDRFEQHEAFYRVMAGEKWAIFLILGFILMIASFNTISSLTLLVLEKKKDMHILQSMGAEPKTIRQVFLNEGLLITGIGILLGLGLGVLFAWIQIQYGVIRFPASGAFIVDVYPIKLLFADFVVVTAMVSLIGWVASVVPVRILGKRYFSSFDGSEINN